MFGLGKNNSVPVTQESVGSVKRKKDGMATIFQESVVETAVEEFKANDAFIVERDGEQVFVAMCLNVENIGGLGKKSHKDEAKGQFIEEVRSGLIKTYMPEDFIENDEMVIIPDASTLSAMDEFMMLTGASYTICYVHDDGSVDKTDTTVTLDKMGLVAGGSEDVLDMLADVGEDWMNGAVESADDTEEIEETDTAEEEEENDDTSSNEDFLSEIDSDESDESDNFDGFELDEEDTYNDMLEDDVSADKSVSNNESDTKETAGELIDKTQDVSEDETADSSEYVPDDSVVTESEMDEAITRRFYSDDLGLEVSTEAFDAQFLHANPYIPFDENRGDGWLNQYLNQMSKDANVEMKHLHQQNLFTMRSMFYQLLSKHSETIQHEFDVNDSSTAYGAMFDAIKQARENARDEVDRRVSDRRKEIEADWEKKLNEVGEDAKRAAEQQYRERFGRQHQEEIYNIEPNIRRQIDSDYDKAVREMHTKRRLEASKTMDYGVTEILAKVSELYINCVADETNVYQNWRKRIADFIDEHRKDEVAHDKALAEELAQKTKADKVLEEYTDKLKEQREEFESKKQSMKAEIESMERKTTAQMHEMQAECDDRIAEMQKRLDEQKVQMTELLDKYAALDASKEKQYSARLTEARDEVEAWSDKCNHIILMHKKSNVVAIMLAVVACIAMLAIGTLIGSNMNLNLSSKNASAQIVQEFRTRMDRLESKQAENNVNSKPLVDSDKSVTSAGRH